MNEQALDVRRATMADLDTIVRFNRAMATESEGMTLDGPTVTEGVRQALADENKSLYFVAENDGQVAGQTMITTEWSDWRNGFFWWIQSVYVDQPYRRRGVFRALHAHIRDLAKAQPNVCGIRLYVYRENERAIETYRNLDMTVTDYRLCEEVW